MEKKCGSCKWHIIDSSMSACANCLLTRKQKCFMCNLYIIHPTSTNKICEKCHSAQYKQCVGFKDNNCQEKIPKYGRLRYNDRCNECFRKHYIDNIRTIRNKK